jgi:Tfp pilus assembly protein PilX
LAGALRRDGQCSPNGKYHTARRNRFGYYDYPVLMNGTNSFYIRGM